MLFVGLLGLVDAFILWQVLHYANNALPPSFASTWSFTSGSVIILLGLYAMFIWAWYTYDAIHDKFYNIRPKWMKRLHLRLTDYRIRHMTQIDKIRLERRVGWGLWRIVAEWDIRGDAAGTYEQYARNKMDELIQGEWEYAYGEASNVICTHNARRYYVSKG